MSDGALVLLGTMRLIRFVTTDSLGTWLIKEPAYRWAKFDPRTQPDPITGREKLVSALECSFCSGTWIGYMVLASQVATRNNGRRTWRFVMTGLALNEVAAHVGNRLGD